MKNCSNKKRQCPNRGRYIGASDKKISYICFSETGTCTDKIEIHHKKRVNV
jgi:hypothetical protein